MIKKFDEYNQINEFKTGNGKHPTSNAWGSTRAMVNQEEFDRFLDMDGGLCVILCDDKSVNRGGLFEDGLPGVDDIYRIGDFTSKPAVDAKEINNEFVQEVRNGVCIDSKILVFVRFDIPNKWDDYVRIMLNYATNIVKLNTVDYSNYQKSKTAFKKDITSELEPEDLGVEQDDLEVER